MEAHSAKYSNSAESRKDDAVLSLTRKRRYSNSMDAANNVASSNSCCPTNLLKYLIVTISFLLALELTSSTNSLSSKLEVKGKGIGDYQRSNKSSLSFFDSVDKDGDGSLERFELEHFLKKIIGGKDFDDKKEVDKEVQNVMKRLDLDNDGGLEKSDVVNHWESLESLMGAEQVAEWIENAVQLPEEVVRTFRDNMVTGYDFPELVEDNGKRLEEDLNITSKRFREKIIRLVQARMIGIGSVPTKPKNIKVEAEGCSSVSLSWDPSKAEGFPVHKYRVQRRILEGTSEGSERNLTVDGNDSNSDWATVHSSAETKTSDSISKESKYKYRVEAWNAAGRSDWETIDVEKHRKKQKCKSQIGLSRSLPKDEVEKGSLTSFIVMITSVCTGLSFLISFVFQVAQLFHKSRRLNKPFTGEDDERQNSMFTKMQRTANLLSMYTVGHELLPESTEFTDETGMSNVDGFKKITASRPENTKVVHRSNNSNVSTHHDKDELSDMTVTVRSRDFKPNYAIHPIGSPSVSTQEKTSDGIDSKKSSKKKKIRVKKNTKKIIKKISSFGSNSSTIASPESCLKKNTKSARLVTQGLDTDYCSQCHQKYKSFGKGKHHKHHCRICHETFCHKCGHTTHMNMLPCGVPGTCECRSCHDNKTYTGNMR